MYTARVHEHLQSRVRAVYMAHVYGAYTQCVTTIFFAKDTFYAETYSDETFRTRMWANAQPDGRPAEHWWRHLFNAAKSG